jgi:hypothetical protein
MIQASRRDDREMKETGWRFIRRPEWGFLVFTSRLLYIRKLALKRSLNYVKATNPSTTIVTDLQGPPSERTQMEKIRDLKSLARQYARDRGSCDDTRISYLEYVESEAEADWTLARMIAG